jgi:hypothetical protein
MQIRRIVPIAPTLWIGKFALAVSLLSCSSILRAQIAAPPQAAKPATARASGGAPDLSGNWLIAPGSPSWDSADPAGKNPQQLPMTPWAREKLSAAKPPFGDKGTFDNPNDPVQKYCDPPGLTRMYGYPWQFTIVQTPANVFILFEYYHEWRLVTMNQPHPKDVDSTWLGDSVGKYDGDALIIDTVGLNGKSWLDNVGHPHSDALHLIERLQLASHSVLQLDLTIEDPKAYTKSWTSRRTFKLSSDPMGETMCSLSENEDFQKNIMDRTVPATPAKK